MAKKKDVTDSGKSKRSDPDMEVVKGVSHSGSAMHEEFIAYDRFYTNRNASQPYSPIHSGPNDWESDDKHKESR